MIRYKQQLLLWCSIHLLVISFAQSIERQVIGSSGTLFTTANAQLDFTIGESVSTDLLFSTHLTQGFQQGVYSLPLALEIIDLTPLRISVQQVVIHWSWNGTTKPEQFLIQRKLDENDQFKTVITIPYQENQYQWLDENNYRGISYYRIIAQNHNKEWLSPIKSVDNPFIQIRLYPNPTTDQIFLTRPNSNDLLQCTIVDAIGKVMQQFSWPSKTSVLEIDISSLPSGKYYMIINQTILSFVKI